MSICMLSDERYVENRRELAGGRDLLAENDRLREALELIVSGEYADTAENVAATALRPEAKS